MNKCLRSVAALLLAAACGGDSGPTALTTPTDPGQERGSTTGSAETPRPKPPYNPPLAPNTVQVVQLLPEPGSTIYRASFNPQLTVRVRYDCNKPRCWGYIAMLDQRGRPHRFLCGGGYDLDGVPRGTGLATFYTVCDPGFVPTTYGLRVHLSDSSAVPPGSAFFVEEIDAVYYWR